MKVPSRPGKWRMDVQNPQLYITRIMGQSLHLLGKGSYLPRTTRLSNSCSVMAAMSPTD